MSASGPAVSISSTGCCATRTSANPPPAPQKKETTDERPRSSGPLWRADRACHAEDPAQVARSHRTRLGVSHRERPAPPVAGGGPDGDESRRDLRIRLA